MEIEEEESEREVGGVGGYRHRRDPDEGQHGQPPAGSVAAQPFGNPEKIDGNKDHGQRDDCCGQVGFVDQRSKKHHTGQRHDKDMQAQL